MYNSRRTSRSPSPSMAKQRHRSRSRSISTRRSTQHTQPTTSSKSHSRHQDEHGNIIDDGPVETFVTAIDTLPGEEWRARTLAFESLIESLPDPSNYTPTSYTPWFKSSPTLRRMHRPISALLLDGRSTVVKHTCQHLAYLVQRVSYLSPPQSDMCKYLLKDLLPTILSLHGQTVNLIRGYTLEMMTVVISACRFKSGLPVLLERLRKDKSRDVREACIRYLRLILRHWTQDSALSFGPDGEPKKQLTEGYLTSSICVHIGNGLARALMDPSQVVRVEARNTFELFRLKYPDTWNHIVQKKDGILSKDARLKKSIINAAMKADSEGKRGVGDFTAGQYSVTGGSTAYEDSEGGSVKSDGSRESRGSHRSNKSANSWNSMGSFASKTSLRSGYTHGRSVTGSGGGKVQVTPSGNSSIRSNSRGRASGIRGPPVRMAGGNAPRSSSANRRQGMNRQETLKRGNSSGDRDRSRGSSVSRIPKVTSPKRTPTPSQQRPDPPQAQKEEMGVIDGGLGTTAGANAGTVSGSAPPIRAMTPKENSARSLKERVSSSSENIAIATELLTAHKSYIDDLMENLRKEMNCVREFESKIAKAKGSGDDNGSHASAGGGSISEEEVMKYFEQVHLFLERGAENGKNLEKAIEKVSEG